MKGLLLKDLYTLGSLKKYYIVQFLAVAGMAFLIPNNTFFIPASLFFVILTFGSSCFSMDESAHFTPYSIALPVKKGRVVAARYLFMLALVAVFCAAAFGLAMLVGTIQNTEQLFLSALLNTLSYVALSLFCVAVLFPFSYRFGSQKARLAMLGAVALAGGLIALVAFAGPRLLPGINWQAFSSDEGLLGLFLAITGFMLVLYFFSFLLSVRIFRKTEY